MSKEVKKDSVENIDTDKIESELNDSDLDNVAGGSFVGSYLGEKVGEKAGEEVGGEQGGEIGGAVGGTVGGNIL